MRGANKTPSESRLRHGLKPLKAAIRARGIDALDARTTAVRAVNELRASLVRDLGGPDAISAQKGVLLDAIARTLLLVNHIDCYLLEQESLVNKRKRALWPIVRERQTLVDSLARLLAQLGLERVPRAIKPLAEYIREHDRRQKPPRDEEEPPEIDRDKEPEEESAPA